MVRVEGIEAEARTIPTDAPESDGTLEWGETTIVLVRVRADGEIGVGYTYADASVAALVEGRLAPAVQGRDALAGAECWQAMHAALRNAGQAGAGAMALSAVDLALHDLRGRLLGAPVHRLLGTARDAVPIYASGGFCSWELERLRAWCVAHLEHFHDHVRIEDEVFAGVPAPQDGVLYPPERPGLGLEVR
jgi:L-alanine-DL-glutamate epimerase-like enolase superfamily enzyme